MRLILALYLATIAFAAVAEPLFPNSVVTNDLDFIKPEDPTLYGCMTYRGTSRQEMPDKRKDELFANGVHVFNAHYAGVPLWVPPDVGNARAAQHEAPPMPHPTHGSARSGAMAGSSQVTTPAIPVRRIWPKPPCSPLRCTNIRAGCPQISKRRKRSRCPTDWLIWSKCSTGWVRIPQPEPLRVAPDSGFQPISLRKPRWFP